MKIGIKFCGGCNPRYNRKQLFAMVKNTLNQHQFEFIKDDSFYNLIIVFAGCASDCVDYVNLKGEKIFTISTEMQLTEILAGIAKLHFFA